MKSLQDYAQKSDPLQDGCPVRAVLDLVRGRWKPSILFELKSGPQRFSDLQAALRRCTAQALTVQLRQLEADGVISRTVYPEMPARVEYAVTVFGGALTSALDRLDALGVEYLDRRSSNGTPGKTISK
jgi:DNA-binding HxlR family transcriptional regulator